MPVLRRQISWPSVLRDLRNDTPPAVVRAALLAERHAAKIEAIRASNGADLKLWTPAGFDRSAIMAHAARNARAERRNRPGLTWAAAMSEMLTYSWACARAARRAAAH